MTPKNVIEQWVQYFNEADIDGLISLYHEDAINHQVALGPVSGKEAIHQMFANEFAAFKMVCIPEHIFEDGDWAILEWKDPKGFRGCGFFKIENEKIKFQRGYWDKQNFKRLYPDDNI